MPENTHLRLSVAQLTVQPDPGDTAALRDSGTRIRSGVITPGGDWLTRCPADPVTALVTADLDLTAENYARPWRRAARSGMYAQYQAPDDPRSLDRASAPDDRRGRTSR